MLALEEGEERSGNGERFEISVFVDLFLKSTRHASYHPIMNEIPHIFSHLCTSRTLGPFVILGLI